MTVLSGMQVVVNVVALVIVVVVVVVYGLVCGAMIAACNINAENQIIDAGNARKLSSESPKEEGWSWKELGELRRVDKKIKRACEKGHREVTLNYSLRYKVVEKLKEKGYKVIIQTIDKKPIGTVIEW